MASSPRLREPGKLGDTVEYHFRAIDDAQRFLAAFPGFALADHTMSETYSSLPVPFGRAEVEDVCNLYNMTRSPDEIRRLFDPVPLTTNVGNLPPMPEVYPDYQAAIVPNSGDGLELVMARCGMPTPPQFLVGKKADRGDQHPKYEVAALAQVARPGASVPGTFTRFAKPALGGNAWCEMADDRPAFFAGLWARWTSVRKVKDG